MKYLISPQNTALQQTIATDLAAAIHYARHITTLTNPHTQIIDIMEVKLFSLKSELVLREYRFNTNTNSVYLYKPLTRKH